MNDDLQPIKNRLRWLNRGILVLGVAALIGLIVWAVIGLRKPPSGTTTTIIHPASVVPSAPVRLASAVASSAPTRPVPSASQQQRAAATAMAALSAASTPSAPAAAAVATPQKAPAPAPASRPVAAASAQPSAALPVAERAPKAAVKPRLRPHSAVAHHPQPAQGKERSHPATVSSVRSVPDCGPAGWYVQVGAFSQPRSIQRLAQHLHRAGYAEVCLAARQVRGLRLFYVGPYRDAGAARAARAALHKIVGTEGILRRLP